MVISKQFCIHYSYFISEYQIGYRKKLSAERLIGY